MLGVSVISILRTLKLADHHTTSLLLRDLLGIQDFPKSIHVVRMSISMGGEKLMLMNKYSQTFLQL